MSTPVAGMRGAALSLIAVVAVVLTLAGCSSTVTGTAAPESGFKPGDAIPGLLDPGNYPTTPHKPFGTAGPNGTIFEGQRMAEFVVGPWEADPDLVTYQPNGNKVWKDTNALVVALLGDQRGGAAGAHGFVVGFGSMRQSAKPLGKMKFLEHVVLRFPTPADAAAAASDMGVPAPPAAGESPDVPLPIPGHPETVAVTHSTLDGVAVDAFTPHGPYVFYDRAVAHTGEVDAATADVGKMIDLQGPRIDEFTPTDPAKLADLPVDPQGVLTRVLPLAKNESETVYVGSWGPYASLHYTIDPLKDAPLIDQAGILVRGFLKSMVWQTRDAGGASTLLQGFLKDQADDKATKPADGVPGLPSAKCFTSPPDDSGEPNFSCYYAVDRYVVNVASHQNVDVQQQAAAQYLILTAK